MVNHRVALQSPKLFGEAGSAPVLLERTDRRFMPNVIAELSDPDRHADAARTRIEERKGGGFHLYQPVHRVFHIAVVSATCRDAPGHPRLDPLRIESAGLVVRKVRDGRGRELGEHGWMASADGAARWEPPDRWDARSGQHVATSTEGDPLPFADPDPLRRRKRKTGRTALDERIAVLKQRSSSRAESVAPLFPLPPKACTDAGETLLVGLVPTASRETEAAPERASPSQSELEAGGFFPRRLTVAGSGDDVPAHGTKLDFDDVYTGAGAKRTNPAFADYIDFVTEMIVAFDIEGDGPASVRLRALAQRIKLPFKTSPAAETTHLSLYQHLLQAAPVLVRGDRNASFRMPHTWGTITAADEAEAKAAILGVTAARFSSIALDRERFGDRDAQYVVRTYVRVSRDDRCPPDLWWSEPSPRFRISPWYDSSPGPRPTIELPNPLNLGAIKPNVAFSVPSVISDLLGRNSPEDLIDGKGKEPSGTGLAWLCSFSIPIITIVAFILLSLFINLLNLVFWWLPFVKICIPIPKSK